MGIAGGMGKLYDLLDPSLKMGLEDAYEIQVGMKQAFNNIIARGLKDRIKRDKHDGRFGDVPKRLELTEANATAWEMRGLLMRATETIEDDALKAYGRGTTAHAKETLRIRREFGEALAGLGEVLFEWGWDPVKSENLNGSGFQEQSFYSLPSSVDRWFGSSDVRVYAICGGFGERGPYFEYNRRGFGEDTGLVLLDERPDGHSAYDDVGLLFGGVSRKWLDMRFFSRHLGLDERGNTVSERIYTTARDMNDNEYYRAGGRTWEFSKP